jgi:hypothetical protein
MTSIRPERPLPADPHEQHTISNQVIVFAITGLVVLARAFLRS